MDTNVAYHPYYPRSLSLPHYVPNTASLAAIFATLAVPLTALLAGGSFLLHKRRPALSLAERLAFCWFVLSGTLHLGLESYFIASHRTLAGDGFILGQVWKEYAISDSRYLSSDTLLWTIELITVTVVGPLCYLTAHGIAADSPRRHLYQLIVCVLHLYSDVLYFATTILEGSPHSDPHPYYFWFYFVFFNVIWIIVPSILLYQSCRQITNGMAARHREQIAKKSS
ncbi:Emopamil-binding protein [Ramicandelaber brevisporus]|nr:Emopamil-binding protein [Ramicandelaber brevisporus]